MAWPSDRLTTYAPRSQVKSADLNAIQDAIIAQHHGLIPMRIHARAGSPSSNTMVWDGSALDVRFQLGIWYMPIALPVGSRIVNLRGDVKDSTTGPTVATMFFARITSTSTETIARRDSSGSGVRQTLEMNGLNVAVAARELYIVTFSRTQGTEGVAVYHVDIDYDHP